jgi:hypothetical protein
MLCGKRYKEALLTLIIFFLYLLLSPGVNSQDLSDRTEISFGIKAWNPVHIKVEEQKGSAVSKPIRFMAYNSTYYPFILDIDFIQFENVAPRPATRNLEVRHGPNNLFSFSIQASDKGYLYNYSYNYWLSSSDEVLNAEFPYLIPLKEGKPVYSMTTASGKIENSFAGNTGDTVYCMRRGLITAVPRSETKDFRISEHDCLEVLHDDGTYMIYHYLNKSDDFTAPGKIVLPGQPIGTISDSAYLFVSLVSVGIIKNTTLNKPIRYSIGKTGTLSFEEIDGIEKSVHPFDVVTREMKGKELKSLQKRRKS